MSLSTDRSTVSRLTREISDLRSKDAAEMKKEADAARRMNSAIASASRSSNQSTRSNYQSTSTREQRTIETAQAHRARHSADIARKSRELARVQDRIARDEASERKKSAAADLKRRNDDKKAQENAIRATELLRSEYEARVANLEAQIAAQIEAQASNTVPFQVVASEGQQEPYDFFFSHASADKIEFGDAFVAKAEAAGLRVWYDQFEIQWASPSGKRSMKVCGTPILASSCCPQTS